MRKRWLLLTGVLVIAAVVVAVLIQRHREDAKLEAELYCSMDAEIPSIYSPEFKNCVEQYLDD